MGSRRFLLVTAGVAAAILGNGGNAWTQSPTYGVGRSPSAEEIRAWDISISPTGKELPQGQGTAKEGAAIYARKCAACHGANGNGGLAPTLIRSKGGVKSSVPCLAPCVNDNNAMAIHSPYATTMWDYIHRAMPLGQEGSLKADEVYSLTAFLLYSNDVIKQDDVLNAESLPAVQMPNRNGYALAPPWEHGKPRLVDYPVPIVNAPTPAAPQGQAAAPFITHQLKPNIYWIEGGGGNSGVIIGDKGVIVIDAKTTAAGGKELLEAIAKITPKPVTTVILTHSDADHVNGLAAFPAGVKVIAHENNKKEQEAALAAGGRGGPPADHLPTQVISKNKQTLKIEGVKLELFHWAPAHTSGDLVIYVPSEKIVFTGDIIAGGKAADPLIHLEKNGSSEGWITSVKGISAINADQFVEGHGDVLAKADIQKRLTDAEAKRAKIKELVAQGKSLAEIRTAVGDPPPAQGRGGRGPGFPSFTQVVYQELTKKAA